MSKHLEYFHDSHPYDLETRINNWCENHKLEPVSISVLMDGEEFVAFVVVEEKKEKFDSLFTDGGLPL
jgi:hypothetical protein